jgi:pimeloyl-ACP methyl ester carboxylesterase
MKFLQRGLCMTLLLTMTLGVMGLAVQPTPVSVYAQDDDVPRFEPAACMFELPDGAVEGENLECGYLVVPEEHANPTGPTIRLAVAIAKSTGDNPAPDPLVMEQGGPGGSSIDAFIEELFGSISVLRQDRDVIILEQRGTLYSEPALVCPEIFELAVEVLEQDLTYLEESALSDATLLECRERLISEGINLNAFDTVENAADIADLATALQLQQINLYGVSYGTMLALHALRDYPEILRSVTIDAVVPLQTNFITEVPQSANRAFRVLFDNCAADPACSTAMPNLEADFYALVAELNENPITFPVIDPDSGDVYDAVLNGDRLVGIYFQLLYATSVLSYLPKTVYDIQNGNTGFLSLVVPFLELDRTFADVMYYTVVCAEDADYVVEDYDFEGVDPVLVALFGEDTILGACAQFEIEQLEAYVDDPVTSDVPVLVLNGEYDPITPPAFGEAAAETLSNSYIYTFPGVGHGSVFGGDCPLSMFVNFLNNPEVEPDSTCIANMRLEFLLPSSVYSDPDGRFTTALPAGWEVSENNTFVNPASGSEIFIEVVEGTDAAEGLASVLAEVVPEVDVENSISSQEIDLGSGTWLFNIYTASSGFYITLGMARDDGNVYVVILRTNESDFETDATSVQEVLDAMQFSE